MQQHHALLQAVDNQRRARHEQLSALGYSQLVEGFNNVAVSPPRWNGQPQRPQGTLASTSSSSSEAGHARNRQPHHRPRGGPPSNQPKGKGKERDHAAHVAIGDFVAANEDPVEEKRKKDLRIKAFGDVYDPREETIRNDLSLNYLNTGRRPQNMLQGCELEHRFEEYVPNIVLATWHKTVLIPQMCAAGIPSCTNSSPYILSLFDSTHAPPHT